MTSRKLALLITEGGSDASALSVPIQNYLRNNGGFCVFECIVYHTDITIHSKHNITQLADCCLVMDRVSEVVNEFLSSNQNSNKYTINDIGIVMTLSDLDCCYCDSEDVIFNGHNSLTVPDFVHKKYLCNDVQFIVQRNKIKVESLDILSHETMLKIADNHVVPFRAFYFNTNLEHALYGDTAYHTVDEKMMLAKRWASLYKKDWQGFYRALSMIPRLSDDFNESWDERKLIVASFERHSNIKLLIDWIQQMSLSFLDSMSN